MTREELNDLLNMYADAAYWYGDASGDYGSPDPDVHREVEERIWSEINISRICEKAGENRR